MHKSIFSDKKNTLFLQFKYKKSRVPSHKGQCPFRSLAIPVLNCSRPPLVVVVRMADGPPLPPARPLRPELFCGSCVGFADNKHWSSSLGSRWKEPSDRNVKRGADAAGSLWFPSTAAGHRHILEFAACLSDIHSRLVCSPNKRENMQRESLLNRRSLLKPIFLLPPDVTVLVCLITRHQWCLLLRLLFFLPSSHSLTFFYFTGKGHIVARPVLCVRTRMPALCVFLHFLYSFKS